MAIELASKRELVLPRLFKTLSTRVVRSDGGLGAPEPMTLEAERVILRALELMDPDVVMSFLESVVPSNSIDRRRAYIQFLGAAGRATETLRLLNVALQPREKALDPSIARATSQALVSLLKRDPVTFGVLEGGYPVLQPRILPPIIEACGEVGDRRGFQLLCLVAREHEDLRQLVLEQVPAIGRSMDVLLDIEMRGYARELIRSGRAECRAAIRAAATLRDHEAIPSLVALLPAPSKGGQQEHEPSELGFAAMAALRSMTGQGFESRAGWTRWYEAERAWMITERAGVFQKLSSADHRQVAEGLDAIAPHPLVREEFVRVLSDLLQTRPIEIRLLVCRSIESSGVREAIPELVEVLGCEYTQVGVAAHRALMTLTGRELPRDREAWTAVARELGYASVRPH